MNRVRVKTHWPGGAEPRPYKEFFRRRESPGLPPFRAGRSLSFCFRMGLGLGARIFLLAEVVVGTRSVCATAGLEGPLPRTESPGLLSGELAMMHSQNGCATVGMGG
jgi:hypothetical protein